MRKFFFTLLFILILPQIYAQYYEYDDNTGKKIGEEDYIKGQMNEERKY